MDTGTPPGTALPPPWFTPSTPAPPPPRSRRGPLAAAVAVVLVILAIVGFVLSRPDPKVRVAGRFTLVGTTQADGTTPLQIAVDDGIHCHGVGAFADIADGTAVTVRDGAGKVVAVTQLAEGTTVTAGLLVGTCVFSFQTSAPRRDFYTIEVAHRGGVTESLAAVRGGPVQLQLGNLDE